jgi:hypothetical protein
MSVLLFFIRRKIEILLPGCSCEKCGQAKAWMKEHTRNKLQQYTRKWKERM